VHEGDDRNVDRVPRLVGRLYEIVSELEELFPGRHFTLDGHIVGSLGDLLAQYRYEDGKLVQI